MKRSSKKKKNRWLGGGGGYPIFNLSPTLSSMESGFSAPCQISVSANVFSQYLSVILTQMLRLSECQSAFPYPLLPLPQLPPLGGGELVVSQQGSSPHPPLLQILTHLVPKGRQEVALHAGPSLVKHKQFLWRRRGQVIHDTKSSCGSEKTKLHVHFISLHVEVRHCACPKVHYLSARSSIPHPRERIWKNK